MTTNQGLRKPQISSPLSFIFRLARRKMKDKRRKVPCCRRLYGLLRKPYQSQRKRRISMSDSNRRWWLFDAYLSGLIGVGLISTLLYALGITARYPLAIGLQSVRAGWSTLAGSSL